MVEMNLGKAPIKLEEEALCPACKTKIDLNSEFPFAALWQDGEQAGGLIKFLPIVSIIIEFIMLVLVIIILSKK